MGDLNALFSKGRAAAGESPAPAPAPTPPAATAPKKSLGLGGLKLGVVGGTKGGTTQAKGVDKASPKPSKQPDSNPPEQTGEVDAQVESSREGSRFPDETPATQPTRDVPADAEESVKRFVELLDNMHGLTPEPDLASDVIRNIMIELKSNPQYIKHVAPADVRVMIRTMRENMGLAKVTKAEKKATRTKKRDQNMMDDLASLGVDLSNLA